MTAKHNMEDLSSSSVMIDLLNEVLNLFSKKKKKNIDLNGIYIHLIFSMLEIAFTCGVMICGKRKKESDDVLIFNEC